MMTVAAVFMRLACVVGFVSAALFVRVARRAPRSSSFGPLLKFALWCCILVLVAGGATLFVAPTLAGVSGALPIAGAAMYGAVLVSRALPGAPLHRP